MAHSTRRLYLDEATPSPKVPSGLGISIILLLETCVLVRPVFLLVVFKFTLADDKKGGKEAVAAFVSFIQ